MCYITRFCKPSRQNSINLLNQSDSLSDNSYQLLGSLMLGGRGCLHQWPSNELLASLSQLFPFLSAPEFSLQDQAGENKPDTAWFEFWVCCFSFWGLNVTRSKQSSQAKEAGWIWPADKFCWPWQCPCFSQEIVQKKCGLWLLSKHMKFYDQWSRILLVGDRVKLRGCHPFLVGRNLLHSLPVLFSQAEIMHLFACSARAGVSVCNSCEEECRRYMKWEKIIKQYGLMSCCDYRKSIIMLLKILSSL